MSPPRLATTSEAEPALGVTRPADVTDALLATALSGARPEMLVVFGAGGGVADLVTASEAGRVVIADRNVVHAHAAAEAVRGLPQASAVVSEGLSHLEPGLQAGAVALRVPREKQPALQLIWDAYRVLRPGGRLYVAGAVRDGVKPSMQHASDLFGGMQPLAMRKGCRVGVVTRPDGEGVRPEAFASELFDHSRYHTFTAAIRGQTYEVHSRPGVFAWDRLDGGTNALIEALQVAPGDRVLDLGCGYGVVGVVAANLGAGHVTMVDADIVAVESARRTAAANNVEGCEVLLGDGTSGLESDAYDVVAVNPPFHLDRQNDYRTARRFIADAVRVLRPGGRLFLVANRFISYEQNVREAFGAVAVAHEDGSYKVLTAQKPAA